MRGRMPGHVCTLTLRLHLDLHWWGAHTSSLSHMDVAVTLALETTYRLAEVRVGHPQWKKSLVWWKRSQAQEPRLQLLLDIALQQEALLCWASVECLVPCRNCPGMEQQGEEWHLPNQGMCVWASFAPAEEPWSSCQQSCPSQKLIQKEEKMGSLGKNCHLVLCPREPPKTALAAKAFVSASSNTAAWRVFFERSFLVCFFQVAGVVCVSRRWPAWSLSRAVCRGWVIPNSPSRKETSETFKVYLC